MCVKFVEHVCVSTARAQSIYLFYHALATLIRFLGGIMAKRKKRPAAAKPKSAWDTFYSNIKAQMIAEKTAAARLKNAKR